MKTIHAQFIRGVIAMVFAVYVAAAFGEDTAPPSDDNSTEVPKRDTAINQDIPPPFGDNPAGTQAQAPAGKGKTKKMAKSEQPPKPSINGLAMAAANGGVTDCVGRIHQVTDFLTKNARSGAFLFLAPADANRSIVSTSLEIQQSGVSTYASASFAPVGASGCAALYENIAYWGNRCEDVAKKVFASFKPAGKLGATTTMLDGGNSVRVFLMPAGQGCLSIKKEMLY